jgi:hypothetical protein
MYSVPPPGSGAVLTAILNIIQHSDNFQVCKGNAEPDCRQQPDHVQRPAARQRGHPPRHTQHHPAFQTTFRYVKVTLHLTANNLTLYSVPPPGSGAVLAAIRNIIQHSDNFQVCKGNAEPDCQQPDHVQRATARQRGRTHRHTQHHPTFRQLSGM